MPYPTEWNISTEAEVDFSEEENLDVVEVDSLFYSDEGSTPTPNIELSEEGDNDTQMELDVVAEAVFDKQNRKIGEIDYKDEQMQTKVNLLKGEKYSLEHKTVVTKSVKIEPAEHVDLQKVDGEGGGEAMDISDDSGNFEELDENGAEVLGIEKDLHDIEAQEVKALKREPDSGISQSSFDDIERKRERLAKLKADLKSPPTLHSAKFDLKDGPVVACEMENDKNLSPFGPLSFYPVEYELQAGFSDFGARYRHKGVSLTDEEISPKNKKKIDSEQSGNAKFMYFGGTPPPFKSHEFTTAMPPGLSRGLPSPPLTEVGSDDTKREEIGIGSNVSPLWDSEPMNKQANIEDGQNAEDYMFGEKPPWYKEAGARRRRYGSVGKTKTTRFQQDVAGEFAATSQALQKWPPLMGVEAEKTGETKGIKWPGVDSPPKFSGFDEPAVVNMFSLISPQKGFRKMASLLGQGPSKPSDIPSAQNLFGYANSNDPQKGPNREKDKHIRDHVTSHTFVGHNVNSTTTTESTEHYWEAIALLRPAREKILAFEAPFDLVRLLKHVRLLYPVNPLTPDGRYDHLSFRLIRVDVSDRNNPSGFDEIASLSEAHLDGGRLQERYENEIIPRLLSLTETDRVWVVRTFTRLWVQDGRDTSNFFKLDLVFPLPQGASLGTTEYFSAQYDTTPDPPGCIRTEFEAAVLALMGGDVVDIANVQVDRYKKEWLVWTSRMDDATFLRTFLWKIDDPTINIYPPNWHPHQSFEQAEEEREARERRREREVQDGRHMLDLGSRIENPTNSQIMQDFNDAARRDQANQNQDPDIRDQLNTPQMGEQARQVGQLIIELGRQRQTLERVQRTFETANTQTAERIALLNTQNQALRSAARCHLPLGARTCNQDVFGDFQGNLYAMMLSHWRRYHLPQERRCQLHILCHANLDMLNDDELEDHREMHQIEGHAIQEGIQPTNFGLQDTGFGNIGQPNAGPSNARPSNAGPSNAGPSSAGPSSAGPSNAGPSNAGPSNAGPSNAGPSNAGLSNARPSTVPPANTGQPPAPHPSGNPTGGPVGLNASGIDPRSTLNPNASGTLWFCGCSANINSMKRKIELRLKHYNKCGYNDSHLVFRTTGEDRAMKVEKEQAAKAATDSNKIPKTKKERKKPKTKKEGKKPETKEPEEPEEPEPEEERPMTVKEGKKPEKKPETKKEGKRKRSDAADPGEAGGQSKKKKPKK